MESFDYYGESIGNGRYLIRDNHAIFNNLSLKFSNQPQRIILSYLPSILKTSFPQSNLLVNEIFKGKPKAIAIIKSEDGYLLNIAIPLFLDDIVILQKQQRKMHFHRAFEVAKDYNAKQVTLTGILPDYYFNDPIQLPNSLDISSGYASRAAAIFTNIIGALNSRCIREINTIAIIGCEPFGITIIYMLIQYGIIIHNILLFDDNPQTIKENLPTDFRLNNIIINDMSNFIGLPDASIIVSSVKKSEFLSAQDIRPESLFFNYSEWSPFSNENYIQLLEKNINFCNAGVLASKNSVEQLFLMPSIPELTSILRCYGLNKNLIAGCSIAGLMPPSTTFDCYKLAIESAFIYKKMLSNGSFYSSENIQISTKI